MEELPFKTGVFDKPARINLKTIVAVVNWDVVSFGFFGLFFGEVNIFKEGTGTRGSGGVGKFVFSDGGDDSADVFRAKICFVVIGDVLFDGIIKWVRELAWVEFESNRNDKIAVFLSSIEETVAVGEMKIGI